MRLEPLMTLHADLEPPAGIGAGPFGVREIYDVKGGTFEGDRLRGRLLPSGADWLLVDAGGVGRLDVRATLETDDGALIFNFYRGRLDATDPLGRPIYAAPLYETGDERYAWINKIQAVAKGKTDGQVLEYEIYEVR
jgi:hypothetical protein